MTAAVVLSEMSGEALRIHASSPDHLVGSWREVSICVWRRETTLEGVRGAVECYEHVRSRCPGGVYMLTVIEQSASLPPADIRQRLSTALERTVDPVLSAVVYEGSGFRAAAVRGVVTGLTALKKLPYPHRVFASVNAASEWFDDQATTKSWTGIALVRALDNARNRSLAGRSR